MSTDNTSKIKPEVQAVSDDIFKHVKIHKDGTAAGHEDRFTKFIEGAGKTIADVNEIHELESTFAAGVTHGVGRLTENAFVKHAALTDIAVSVPMALDGRNKFVVAAEREHTYPTPGRNGQPAGSVTKYNDITTKYHTVEGNFSAGQLKVVKQELNASAREALGGVKA